MCFVTNVVIYIALCLERDWMLCVAQESVSDAAFLQRLISEFAGWLRNDKVQTEILQVQYNCRKTQDRFNGLAM